jgi:hypothetical protein
VKNLSKKLSREELSILKTLVGQNFNYIGGPNVPEFLVSDQFVIGGSKSSVTIHGDVENQPLIGEFEECSHFVVKATSEEFAQATLESGNTFLLNRRALIENVSVVSESLTQTSGGASDWTYESDVAIVLHTGASAIVLRLSSLSMEAIVAEFIEDFSLASIQTPSSHFEDNLLESYASKLTIRGIN